MINAILYVAHDSLDVLCAIALAFVLNLLFVHFNYLFSIFRTSGRFIIDGTKIFMQKG